MIKRFVASGLFFMTWVAGFAAAHPPPPPPPTGAGPGCWPPPCVPIDGGIAFLIAAGALYGGKKLYDQRVKSKRKFS